MIFNKIYKLSQIQTVINRYSLRSMMSYWKYCVGTQCKHREIRYDCRWENLTLKTWENSPLETSRNQLWYSATSASPAISVNINIYKYKAWTSHYQVTAILGITLLLTILIKYKAWMSECIYHNLFILIISDSPVSHHFNYFLFKDFQDLKNSRKVASSNQDIEMNLSIICNLDASECNNDCCDQRIWNMVSLFIWTSSQCTSRNSSVLCVTELCHQVNR